MFRWLFAARLKTLSLSLAPVAAGSWLAAQQGDWRPGVVAVAMGAAVAIQIGTNLWNDAADAGSGIDGADRLGPPRMVALGLLDAARVRAVAAGTFALAALAGLWLATIGGWPILLIGALSLGMGYAYSMGPRPLSATPLGELLVIAFFGVVAVAGTVHLHGAPVGARALALGLITGLPAAAVLLINNHRDRVGDASGGRRTLAILIGPAGARLTYALLLTLSLLGAVLFVQTPWPLLPAALLGLVLVTAMARLPVSTALNRLIPGTALFQILLLTGIALA